MPSLSKKRKGGLIDDMQSDEDIFGKVMMSKEPRLSLILDGLTTFQRNRLKKSTEWGNLEDAILKFNQEDESITSFEESVSLDHYNFNFGDKSPEFDALVNKINEIKRESLEIESEAANKTEKKVKNQIWPTFEIEQPVNGSLRQEPVRSYDKRQQVPERVSVAPPVVDFKTIKTTQEMDPSVERRQPNPVAVFDIPTPEYKEEARIAFSSVQLNPKAPEKVNTRRQRVPDDDLPVTAPPPPPEEAADEVPESPRGVLKEDWNISIRENIGNTSPPPQLDLEDEVSQELSASIPDKLDEVTIKPAGHTSSTTLNRSEEVLSKIPLA
ncbi:hypothetical protein NQ315_001231 [Exocentrus adspersus]|uniref:Uncharacterized protein n=1 Tax=Exocentrus adspersus TaxID=1586481 RepID=A0AAV8WEC2_9CUCU|nr:hypothetical protein NQ315_001231 [Exocentrus adspersus]